MDSEKEAAIVGQFNDKIYYFALKKVKDREAALDIAQDTILAFLEVYRRGDLKNPDNPAGLAYGIFKNKLAGYFEKVKRAQNPPPQLSDHESAVADESLARLINETQEKKIRASVGRLKTIDRQILALFFHDNRSCQEIATQLQLDPHFVSVRKWRALKKLQKWLR